MALKLMGGVHRVFSVLFLALSIVILDRGVTSYQLISIFDSFVVDCFSCVQQLVLRLIHRFVWLEMRLYIIMIFREKAKALMRDITGRICEGGRSSRTSYKIHKEWHVGGKRDDSDISWRLKEGGSTNTTSGRLFIMETGGSWDDGGQSHRSWVWC